MDVLAHTLWANLLFLKEKGSKRFWAVAGGVLPDLIVFIPAYIIGLFTIPFDWQSPPGWVSVFYNITHSLIIFAIVALIVWLIKKDYLWLMAGWLLHIILDIFSHKQLYQTQFLYPLTDFSIGIFSWGDFGFMLINYGLLAAIYLGLWFHHLRHRNVAAKLAATPATASPFPPSTPVGNVDLPHPISNESAEQLLKEAAQDKSTVSDLDVMGLPDHQHPSPTMETVEQILASAKKPSKAGKKKSKPAKKAAKAKVKAKTTKKKVAKVPAQKKAAKKAVKKVAKAAAKKAVKKAPKKGKE